MPYSAYTVRLKVEHYGFRDQQTEANLVRLYARNEKMSSPVATLESGIRKSSEQVRNEPERDEGPLRVPW